MTHDAVPSEERFTAYYAAPRAPWDIGRPQRAFVEASEGVGGRVLDSGCGTGDLAIWLAERGRTVTGVDFLEPPLEVARRKAAAGAVAVTLTAADVAVAPELWVARVAGDTAAALRLHRGLARWWRCDHMLATPFLMRSAAGCRSS